MKNFVPDDTVLDFTYHGDPIEVTMGEFREWQRSQQIALANAALNQLLNLEDAAAFEREIIGTIDGCRRERKAQELLGSW